MPFRVVPRQSGFSQTVLQRPYLQSANGDPEAIQRRKVYLQSPRERTEVLTNVSVLLQPSCSTETQVAP